MEHSLLLRLKGLLQSGNERSLTECLFNLAHRSMPTYIYRREDGTTFEINQRITEAPLQTCPTTGQRVTRVITGGTGLIFKGSGFYLTDYARSNGSSGASSTTSTDTSNTSTSTPENKSSTTTKTTSE